MEWHPHLTCSLIFRMDLLMSLMCSFAAHVCRWAGAKKLRIFSNSLSPCKSVMVKPLSLYLVFTCFNTDIVSYFPLLLHDWTDLKYIFLGLMCRKGLPLTKEKYMDSSTLWWFLDMRGGKDKLGMVLWWPGLLLIALPCILGIWGTYIWMFLCWCRLWQLDSCLFYSFENNILGYV